MFLFWYNLKQFGSISVTSTKQEKTLGVKNLPANARDAGDSNSIPGSGRSPGEGSGNPLQYSCLENPTDRGAQGAIAHGVTHSQM